MAIGKVGSFATDAPIQRNYIGDALSEVENQGFKYRAERRLMADEEKAKIREQEEKEDRLATHLKTFNVDKVGNQSIDDPIQKLSFETFNRYTDLENQLQKTSDPNERLRLKSLQAKLEQNINNAKQIPVLIKEKQDFILKNYEKINPDDADIVAQGLDALNNKNFSTYIDDNGNLKINVYKSDENGNVTDILAESTDALDYVNKMNPHLKSNFESILKSHVDNTGTSLVKKQTGSRIRETKGVLPEVEKERANSLADMVVSNPNELYAASKRYGKKIDDIEGIKEAVRKDFKNALPKEYKEDIDAAYINATKPEKSSGGSGKEEKPPVLDWSKPVIIKNTLGNAEARYFGSNVPSGTRGIPISGVSDDLGGGKKTFVRGIYMAPGGKDFYIAVEESGFESESTTAKGEVTTTQSNKKPIKKLISYKKQADQFANQASLMGFSDSRVLINQMVEKLGKRNTSQSEAKTQAKKNTIKVGEVVEGYKFLGGDPNNSKSWKKI